MKLKKWVSLTLYTINVMLVMLMLMLDFDSMTIKDIILFYSIGVNIISLNIYILKRYSKQSFIQEYMNILED